MTKRKNKPKLQLHAGILVWAMTCSCLPASCAIKLGSATAKFDAAAQESVKLLSDFYQGLNDLERSAYVEKVFFDPSKRVGFVEGQQTTGLETRYSPKDLQARVAVLQALTAYTRGLMQLASDTPVKSIEGDIGRIGTSLIAIEAQFQSLTVKTTDSKVKIFASPLATLASFATKHWLTAKRDAALREAIANSDEHIGKLFDLLEADVSELHNGVVVRAANSSIGRYIDFYNSDLHAKEVDLSSKAMLVLKDGRLPYLQQLNVAATRYANVESTNPTSIIKRMRAVHNDLVKCAKNKKPPITDVNELLIEVESYTLEVQRVASAARALKEAL